MAQGGKFQTVRSISNNFVPMFLIFSVLPSILWNDVAFHIKTSHLICCVNWMTGFYMECNSVLQNIEKHWIYVGTLKRNDLASHTPHIT